MHRLYLDVGNLLLHARYKLLATDDQTDPETVSHIHHDGPPQHPRACLFVAYCAQQSIPRYIFHHLKALHAANFDIIYCSHSAIPDLDFEKLRPLCRTILTKANQGLDFSAWSHGLRHIQYGKDYDAILLTNDSIIGPFYPLEPIFDHMTGFDMWGLTESECVRWHLQSYFLYINKPILESTAWQQFWRGIKSYRNKYKIVYDYETGLSKRFKRLGYSLAGYITQEKLKQKDIRYVKRYHNPTIKDWDKLVERFQFPFIKRMALHNNPFEDHDSIMKKLQLLAPSLDHFYILEDLFIQP